MARTPAARPHEEIALHEYLTEAKIRLEAFGQGDPLVDLGLAEATKGLNDWERYLRGTYEQLLSGAAQAPTNTVKLDAQVKADSRTLEGALKGDGRAAEVARVHKEHNGLIPIANGLLEVAKASTKRGVVGAAEDLKVSLAALTEQKDRASTSGHPVFDQKTVQAARKAWAHLDNAFDVIGMKLRLLGIEYDPVFANRPTLQSSLRLTLRLTPPSDDKPAKHRKPSGDKGGKAGGDKKNGETPAESQKPSTGGPAAPN